MGEIVIGFLDNEGLGPRGASLFAQQLGEVESPERRAWLKTYLSESAYFLLQGIVDQTCSLDSILATPNPAVVSITGHALFRTILEYAYKLTYLTDPEIGGNTRIRRTIELGYADLCAYERLPSELQGGTSPSPETLLRDWYKEVTEGSELREPKVRSIFDAVGDPEDDGFPWPKDGSGKAVNPVYVWGYRVTSPIVHGNLWAIKHHGLTHVSKSGGVTTALPGLDAKAMRLLREGAARSLQLSFGITVQLMHGHLPSDVMNRLEAHIELIRTR